MDLIYLALLLLLMLISVGLVLAIERLGDDA
jgi:hypothetical protein